MPKFGGIEEEDEDFYQIEDDSDEKPKPAASSHENWTLGFLDLKFLKL